MTLPAIPDVLLPVPADWDEKARAEFETWSDEKILDTSVDAVIRAAAEMRDALGQDAEPLWKGLSWKWREVGRRLGEPEEPGRPTADRHNVTPCNISRKEVSEAKLIAWCRVFDRWVQRTDEWMKEAFHKQGPRPSQVVKWARIWDRKHTPAKHDASIADLTLGSLTLLHGDCNERLLELEAGSVDLILTDPPYPKDELPRWTDLGRLAKRLLGPRGILFAWSGQLWLPEVFDRLRGLEPDEDGNWRRTWEGLNYGWTWLLRLPGSHSRVPARHIMQAWKPILAFTAGTWPALEWYDDELVSPKPQKGEYEWSQNLEPARILIERYAPAGGLILDPFLGVGSFGAAAAGKGLRFVGVELDAERFEAARRNLEGLAWE